MEFFDLDFDLFKKKNALNRMVYLSGHALNRMSTVSSFASSVLWAEPAYPIGPNRLGPRLLQPIRPMLSLYLNTPPQAQLEALRDPRAHGSGSSWLHASLTLLDLFDSARLDPFGQVVCSCDLFQIPFSCSVGASSTSFSSAWPLVDSTPSNQTSEQNRLPPIGSRFHPSCLSPTRL